MAALAAFGNALLIIGAALLSISLSPESRSNLAVQSTASSNVEHLAWLKQDEPEPAEPETCDEMNQEFAGFSCSEDQDSNMCDCEDNEKDEGGNEEHGEINVDTGDLRSGGCDQAECDRHCRGKVPANRLIRASCGTTCTCVVVKRSYCRFKLCPNLLGN